MSKSELQLNFDARVLAKENLNDEQLQAISHKFGPMLVVAGAGTGKTRVITERIAWLIKENLAKPEEILALTFTEKAANEMEVRVDQLLPYGLTNTNIFTFHGFCDSVLREVSLEVGLMPEFKLLNDKESELLLRDRIGEVENISELRSTKNPYQYVGEIMRVISRAKDELVGPEQYDLEAKKIASISPNEVETVKQREISKIYGAYEEWKQEIGALDFGDLIAFLTNSLKTNNHLKNSLQNRYKFILIDEFQDTNKAQYELVKSILGPQKNLTVVGDDDQSIYAFRGAALNNILGFIDDFPDSKIITLTKNYRSTQKILDSAHSLITKNNPDRLEQKLHLSKKLSAKNEGSPVIFHWYQSATDEFVSIASKIKELKTNSDYRNIAILVRSNASVEQIGRVLDLEQIPFITNFDNTFSYRPEIRGVIAFFRALKNPHDSEAIMKLALSPFYDIPATEFLYILDNSKKTHTVIDAILRNPDSKIWQSLKPETQKLIFDLRDELDKLRELIKTKNAGEILYEFLKTRGFLKKSELDKPENVEMLANIMVIFNVIKNWLDVGGNPFATHFIDELEVILKDITPPDFENSQVDAVNILTIHASKGLEFDHVFLPMMVNDRFPSRMRQNALKLLEREESSTEDHIKEERRLAYVALTRAKKDLFMSGSLYYGKGLRAKKPSKFIMESLGLDTIPAPITVENNISPLALFSPKKPIATTIGYPAFNGVITLSPSMIESYLKCPYEFYWRYVLKAPSEPNHNLIYGSAIHAGIEAFFKARQDKEEHAIEAFTKSWQEEGFPDAKTRDDLKRSGLQALKNFIKRSGEGTEPQEVERSFALSFEDIRIKGRIDAFYSNPMEIKDFKTSKIKNDLDANRKLKENFPLKVYALAIFEEFGQIPILSLDFVEHDFVASYTPKEKELEKTRDKILQVATGIKSGEFEPNLSEHFCDVCGKI